MFNQEDFRWLCPGSVSTPWVPNTFFIWEIHLWKLSSSKFATSASVFSNLKWLRLHPNVQFLFRHLPSLLGFFSLEAFLPQKLLSKTIRCKTVALQQNWRVGGETCRKLWDETFLNETLRTIFTETFCHLGFEISTQTAHVHILLFTTWAQCPLQASFELNSLPCHAAQPCLFTPWLERHLLKTLWN